MRFVFIIFSIVLLISSCIKNEIEYGMSFEKVGDLVDADEANYMKELGYIFNKHEMIFNWEYIIRDSKTYSFIAKNENFDLDEYMLTTKQRIIREGWVLVEKNNYGEFYCDKNNNNIGITFPMYDKKLDRKNKGYYTFQAYKKLAITFNFTPNGNGEACKRGSYDA